MATKKTCASEVTKKPRKAKESFVNAELRIMGKVIKVKAKSVIEALNLIDIGNNKGKAILTVEKDGVKRERVLMPMIVSRAFNTRGLIKEISIKRLSDLF